jgi:hypothetical protein
MVEAGSAADLSEALAQWRDFYTLLGAASATLVGLLFVAASVGVSAFSSGRRAASRIFLSASVVHFSSLLAASLIVMVPGLSWRSFGMMIAACGMVGLGYYVLTWRDMLHDGLAKRIDWDDHIWYAVMPVIGYLCETAAGVTLMARWPLACDALAASLGLLLIIGLHNAWDITLWSITRRRE